jgi:hypothetical protein
MNRLFAIAPLALLSTSAACEVQTPATALDVASSESAPTARQIVLPSDAEALASWQLPPQSPWSRYEKLTLLTYLADTPVVASMPDVGGLDVVHRAQEAAARLAMLGLPEGTLWIVDLRGAASVAFGATLSRMSSAKVAPVMTFNNWPAEHEVVPAEQTLAALVTMRPRLLTGADVVATPVFLLDAWRLAYREVTPDPEAIDNRYILLPSDFPDPATLRAAGIHRVVYVVEERSSASTEEDDVHEVALDYQHAGIGISFVDLNGLAQLGGAGPEMEREARWDPGSSWDLCFSDWSFTVGSRSTILDDPAFYARARGGFGGVRAAPQGGGRAYAPAHPSAGGSSGAHLGGGHAGSSGSTGRAYSGASPHVSGHGGG